MTIQEYSNKINNLRVEENMPELSDYIDLENNVSKILQHTNGSHFALKALFDQSVVESVILNTEVIELFANHLGLMFLSEKENGNVCFANSSELRPEFRQSFTTIDILDYIHAFIHSSFYKEFQKIKITSEVNLFWKLVKIGAALREENK